MPHIDVRIFFKEDDESGEFYYHSVKEKGSSFFRNERMRVIHALMNFDNDLFSDIINEIE